MPTDPTPTPADIEAARACWLTFAEFPTYIREEKAVQRIAHALATARADAAQARHDAEIAGIVA